MPNGENSSNRSTQIGAPVHTAPAESFALAFTNAQLLRLLSAGDADNAHLFWSTILPRHRMYNVFVPLVDLQTNAQGTQFWPGSHHSLTRKPRYRAAIQRSRAIEADTAAMDAMEARHAH